MARDRQETLDVGAAPVRKRVDWRWLGRLIVRLLLDAALIDVAIETWYSGSATRIWVVAPIAAYVLVSLWAIRLGARLAAPGIFTQTPAAFYVFLAILGAMTQDKAGLASGVTLLKQPMPVILVGTALLITVLATLRFAAPRGTAWWFRLAVIAIGAYAAASLALGIRGGVPIHDLLNGNSEWKRLPYWLQGAFVGGAVLTPAAFVRELAVSMKVLKLTGHLRWMVVFGLAYWIILNSF